MSSDKNASTAYNLLRATPINVTDESGYLTIIKNKKFQISFTNKLEAVVQKGDVFTKTKTSKQIAKKIDKNITVDTILPAFLTLHEFRMLIAAVLEVHIDAIHVVYERFLDAEIADYETFVVIGVAEPIDVEIKPTSKSRFNNYDEQCIKVIEKYRAFLIKQNTKLKSSIKTNITKIVYAMYSHTLTSIDIVRLFNINETSERFPKINIHSTKLNDFKNEVNPLACTVKCRDATMRPLQGIYSSKNECTFLNNKVIDDNESISLYNISALENGIVLFYFSISRFDMDKSEIDAIIQNWMHSSAHALLSDIHLDECVLDPEFKISDCLFIEMCHDMHVQLTDKLKLSSMNALSSMPAFKSVYTMLSSTRSLGPQVHSLAAQYLLNRTYNATASLSSTTMNFYYYPLIHLTNETEGDSKRASTSMIEIRNSVTVENTLLILAAIAMCFGSLSSSAAKDLSEVDPRVRIHQLKLADPVLFGNKIKNDMMRDYSQLVQDNKQRPSVLTEKEYKEMRKDEPNAVLNIENQTTHSRLFLGCVFDEFPIINYHAESDGSCIVKCTTAYANAFQYQTCDGKLNGIGNEKTVENKFFSNTIVKYSPAIDIGRRCLPPKELLNIFPKCHLLKVANVQSAWRMSDGSMKKVFIIARYSDHYVIETEYVDEYSYILEIKTDGFPGAFVLRDTDTNVPIIFNHDTKNAFMEQLIKISKRHDVDERFVNYVNHIIGSTIPPNESVTNTIIKLRDDYNIAFYRNLVDYHYIVAMKYNNEVYLLPATYNISIKIESAEDNINDVLEKESVYPKISKFDVNGIEKYYIDYSTRKVAAIRYYGCDTIVYAFEPKKVLSANTSERESSNIEYIDFNTWILKHYGLRPTPISKPPVHVDLIDKNLLILKYISIVLQNSRYDTNAETLKKKMLSMFNNSISDETKLVYINHSVSWRKSKIDSKSIESIDWSEQNIMRLMYELEQNEANLVYDDTKEYIYERAIY